MPYYNLEIVAEPGRVLSEPARDRAQALAIFGTQLGVTLTLDEQEAPASYMLGEFDDPHAQWMVARTIPVWISN